MSPNLSPSLLDIDTKLFDTFADLLLVFLHYTSLAKQLDDIVHRNVEYC